MTWFIWRATRGFLKSRQGLAHISMSDKPGGRTLCGKSINETWNLCGSKEHELGADKAATCQTCRTNVCRRRRERVNNRPKFPEGTMYAGHKVRSL